MSLRSKNRQRLVRATSTVLAVTLVLLLTPCCEVFAALAVADVPVNTDVCPANHHDDGHAPPSGEHCAPWLEQAFIVPGSDAVLPSSGPSDVAATLQHEQVSVPIMRTASVVPYAGAPPPTRAISFSPRVFSFKHFSDQRRLARGRVFVRTPQNFRTHGLASGLDRAVPGHSTRIESGE